MNWGKIPTRDLFAMHLGVHEIFIVQIRGEGILMQVGVSKCISMKINLFLLWKILLLPLNCSTCLPSMKNFLSSTSMYKNKLLTKRRGTEQRL